jgi:hypothetical protein
LLCPKATEPLAGHQRLCLRSECLAEFSGTVQIECVQEDAGVVPPIADAVGS